MNWLLTIHFRRVDYSYKSLQPVNVIQTILRRYSSTPAWFLQHSFAVLKIAVMFYGSKM